jgi:hypothetical protein
MLAIIRRQDAASAVPSVDAISVPWGRHVVHGLWLFVQTGRTFSRRAHHATRALRVRPRMVRGVPPPGARRPAGPWPTGAWSSLLLLADQLFYRFLRHAHRPSAFLGHQLPRQRVRFAEAPHAGIRAGELDARHILPVFGRGDHHHQNPYRRCDPHAAELTAVSDFNPPTGARIGNQPMRVPGQRSRRPASTIACRPAAIGKAFFHLVVQPRTDRAVREAKERG